MIVKIRQKAIVWVEHEFGLLDSSWNELIHIVESDVPFDAASLEGYVGTTVNTKKIIPVHRGYGDGEATRLLIASGEIVTTNRKVDEDETH